MVAHKPEAPATAKKKNWLSPFLAWSAPYRAFAAICGTVIVSVSGGVAWIVAHFATQAELQYLECRVTDNILTQLLPIHIEEFAGKIDWRLTQIKALSQHGGGTPQSISVIADLTDQANTLNKDEQEAAAKFKAEIDSVAAKCISEAPQVAETPRP
jgi:hypothetical protein